MRRLLLPVCAALTLALIAAVLLRAPFANGPAEWEWPYRPPGLAAGPAVLALLAGGLIAGSIAGLAGRARAGMPLLLAALGFLFTLALTAAQPDGFDRVLRSLGSRNSFGYVFDAGLAPPTRELLADYPRAVAGLNQHSRTHPPGPLLLVRGLDALGRRIPAGREDGAVARAGQAFEREIQRARDRGRPAPRGPLVPAAGTLVLLALLLPALSALAAWPLCRLARAWGLSPETAQTASALWLLVPARSLFTPSLDPALPALLLAAAVLATPRPAAARRETWRPLLAGLLAGVCVLTTYGYVAVLPLLAGLASLGPHMNVDGEPRRIRLDLVPPLLLGVGFALPWLALAAFAGYDPLPAFRAAMAEHHAIAVATRDYRTWLLWDPYDFALLLGPAVLVPAVAATAAPRPLPFRAGAWLLWGTLLLLLVSGSVRGEVGRIWMMFMPFVCLLAAAGLEGQTGARRGAVPLLQLALTLALAAALVFVT
jgi:hypothetical protein